MTDDLEGKMVECDRCGKQIKQSKVVIDKGVDYPELIKKAKENGKDHLELCPVCADIDMVEEEDEKLDKQMSNIRSFI